MYFGKLLCGRAVVRVVALLDILMFDINIRLDVCCNAAHSHPERIPCSTLTSTFECGLVWQEDAQVVEEAAGRPRRAVRNAQGTTSVKSTSKSTIVKLAPPKAVGLPKPPQVLAKVRGLVAEWKFGFMCWLHAMLANGMNSTNNSHVGLWMALGLLGGDCHETTNTEEKMSRHP